MVLKRQWRFLLTFVDCNDFSSESWIGVCHLAEAGWQSQCPFEQVTICEAKPFTKQTKGAKS
jgi:hypothetical protein